MTDKENISGSIELKTLNEIVEVYQQVAATRMRKVKGAVLQNREFYQALVEVFLQARESYLYIKQNQQEKLVSKLAKKKNANVTLRITNKRTLAVFLSANTGLYGDVMKKVFDLFMEDTKGKDWDLAVIGRSGRNLIQSTGQKIKFKYFDLADGVIEEETPIKKIFEYALAYENIYIYHILFKNIIDQEAVKTIVDKKLDQEEVSQTKSEKETLPFLYEPGIDKVLEFFETQIVYSVFNQAVYESSLGKYASRMVSLDTATENIHKNIKTIDSARRRSKHQKLNKKQMDQVISLRRL